MRTAQNLKEIPFNLISNIEPIIIWKTTNSNAISDFDSYTRNNQHIKQKIIKRLIYIFTELIQNQRKYSENRMTSFIFIEEFFKHDSPILIIHTINQISEQNIKNITDEFQIIKNKNEQELHILKNDRILHSEKGIGLIEIARKSQDCEHEFLRSENQTFIHIKTKIHV